MRKIGTVEERFWFHVIKTQYCWIWDSTKHHRGYGKIRIGTKKVFVHRLSYEMHKGTIPQGMEIDHLCRNRACVNPKHLEAVNHKENVIRGEGPTAINARKNLCKQGHDLSNAPKYSQGRRCIPCQVERTRKYRLKKAIQQLAQNR